MKFKTSNIKKLAEEAVAASRQQQIDKYMTSQTEYKEQMENYKKETIPNIKKALSTSLEELNTVEGQEDFSMERLESNLKKLGTWSSGWSYNSTHKPTMPKLPSWWPEDGTSFDFEKIPCRDADELRALVRFCDSIEDEYVTTNALHEVGFRNALKKIAGTA